MRPTTSATDAREWGSSGLKTCLQLSMQYLTCSNEIDSFQQAAGTVTAAGMMETGEKMGLYMCPVLRDPNVSSGAARMTAYPAAPGTHLGSLVLH